MITLTYSHRAEVGNISSCRRPGKAGPGDSRCKNMPEFDVESIGFKYLREYFHRTKTSKTLCFQPGFEDNEIMTVTTEGGLIR
jgi:hypothetical protein